MKEPNRILFYAVYSFFRFLYLLVFKFFYFLETRGAKNIPKEGGFIFMANHASYFDPPLIGTAQSRRICRFMARDTLFKNKFFGTGIRYTGAFPVKRGKIDRASWAKFNELVKAGEAVVFFPEGTRSETGEIQEGKPGTGMLVHMSRAKVLPVYIDGAFEAWPKGGRIRPFVKITVTYGEMMDFSDCLDKEGERAVYEEITNRVIERLRRMRADFKAAAGAGK